MQSGENPARRLVLVAAAALINSEGAVLITQRPAHKALGGLWEFPGGKIEPGEAPEAALIRELQEELSIEVSPEALSPFAFASHAYADFHLLMPLYLITAWAGAPRLDPHAAQAMQWVAPAALRDIAMPPADLVLVERLIAWSVAYASSSTSQ